MASVPIAQPLTRRPRVALYGHDTLGLGHLRRNLTLAETLSPDEPNGLGAEVLVLTGAREVGLFPRSRGIEALVMPGVAKDARGRYAPRALRESLSSVLRLRRSTLTSSLRAFAPDLLIVDKSPWGFRGELADALPALREAGCTLVLGLRDVLDAPEIAARQWSEERGDAAVLRLYDEVWVYGDREVHDVSRACAMHPSAAAKTVHVGYLASDRPGTGLTHRPVGEQPYVLITAGGGADGAALLNAAAKLPPLGSTQVVILTGPQLHDQDLAALRRATRGAGHIHLHRFSPHSASWIAGAQAVVSMAGANTVAETLATSVPALLVPRVHPRQEQSVRAQALADAGAVDLLMPDQLNTDALARWLLANRGGRVPREHIRLDGLAVLRERIRTLIPTTPAQTGHREAVHVVR